MAITCSGRKHPCPRLQEDAGLAHEDPTEEDVWPPSSPDCNPFRYFVWGEFELWVSAKSRNKTEDLILKIKEVMGSLFKNTVAKAFKSLMSRIEALLLTAVLITKLILNMYLCKFFFYFNKIG
jgi:hypothetical protein